jgi:Family of unknown function (DUF6064)
MIPLSEEALFGLYGSYNQALKLIPNIGYTLCVLALLLAFSPRPGSDRAISAILAAFWIWTGAVFHIGFFAPLNWAAWIFGAFFILQGLLLAWAGVLLNRFDFQLQSGLRGSAGFVLLAFGLAYPMLDVFAGHLWPRLQLPGTLPAPTVLATIGLLLMTRGRAAWPFAVIPLLWGLVGGAAAASLGIWQDAAMGIAALAGFGILAFNRPSHH